jgi:ankyrin repeat protein
VEICRYLIEKGATVDQPDKSGRTALHWATISGHREAATLLVASGACMRACVCACVRVRACVCTRSVLTIHLSHSSRQPKPNTTQHNTTQHNTTGANVMAETTSKMTPLHGAAEGGRVEVLQILIGGAGENKEALFKARDADGQTPLDLAIQNKHTAVVKLLKELGDPNAQSASCSVM